MHHRELGCEISHNNGNRGAAAVVGVFGQRGFSDVNSAGFIEGEGEGGRGKGNSYKDDKGDKSDERKRWVVQPSGATYSTVAVSAGRSGRVDVMMQMLSYIDEEMEIFYNPTHAHTLKPIACYR